MVGRGPTEYWEADKKDKRKNLVLAEGIETICGNAFFECYFNHLFGAGSTDIWILIYLIMSIAGMTTRNAESDGGENGANYSFYTDI